MGVGAFAEPLVVITLLFGGVYVNRNTRYRLGSRNRGGNGYDKTGGGSVADDVCEASSDTSSASAATLTDDLAERGGLLSPLRTPQDEPKWRTREVGLGRFRTRVTSPNTRVFKDYFLSRLLVKFPFLVEVWYWALIYWVSSDIRISKFVFRVLPGVVRYDILTFFFFFLENRSTSSAGLSPP